MTALANFTSSKPAFLQKSYDRSSANLVGLNLARNNWFLERNSALPTQRIEQLQQRLNHTLKQSNSLECNQLAALNILQVAPDKYDSGNDRLYQIYQQVHSDQVKAGILNLLIARNNVSSLEWIEALEVSTPALEQLQLTAIEALQPEDASSTQVN